MDGLVRAAAGLHHGVHDEVSAVWLFVRPGLVGVFAPALEA